MNNKCERQKEWKKLGCFEKAAIKGREKLKSLALARQLSSKEPDKEPIGINEISILSKPKRNLSDVQVYLNNHKSAFELYYKRALRNNSTLKGKATISFTILSSGKVADPNVNSKRVNDPVLINEITKLFHNFNFGALHVEPLEFQFTTNFEPN